MDVHAKTTQDVAWETLAVHPWLPCTLEPDPPLPPPPPLDNSSNPFSVNTSAVSLAKPLLDTASNKQSTMYHPFCLSSLSLLVDTAVTYRTLFLCILSFCFSFQLLFCWCNPCLTRKPPTISPPKSLKPTPTIAQTLGELGVDLQAHVVGCDPEPPYVSSVPPPYTIGPESFRRRPVIKLGVPDRPLELQ